ncbi:MAG: DUF4923 family protein [Bacteroidales bacterium]|nr:DUF4923 family protein [Bacteroidales bacterium]
MKKILLVALLGLFVSQVNAQSVLSSLLNKTLSKESITSIVESVAGKVVSKLDLSVVGTWKYSAAEVQFKSDNLLAEAGGAAMLSTVENSVGKLYAKLGMDSDYSFTFNSDSTFTQNIKVKSKVQTLKGTYSLDKENNLIVLKYQVLGKINLGKVSAIYANNGTSLSILFDANELFTMLKKIASAASSFSSTATLAGLSTIVEQYDGMLLGYKMSRVK